MTRVLVAVKRVAEPSSEPLLTEDQQGLDGRFAGYTIGDHDACAVELGIQVAEATDGSVTVVSVGAAEAVEQIRGALSLGAQAGILVETDPAAMGPADVAAELAAVVADAEATGEPFELMLLGNDATDTGDFQVPIRLAYLLARPVVTGASVTRVVDGDLVATVKGPYGPETYVVPVPAVAAVAAGGTQPRYPSLKGRMAARKIEVEVRPPAGVATGSSGKVRWHLLPRPPSTTEVLGAGPEAAPAVVDLLQRLAVLP